MTSSKSGAMITFVFRIVVRVESVVALEEFSLTMLSVILTAMVSPIMIELLGKELIEFYRLGTAPICKIFKTWVICPGYNTR